MRDKNDHIGIIQNEAVTFSCALLISGAEAFVYPPPPPYFIDLQNIIKGSPFAIYPYVAVALFKGCGVFFQSIIQIFILYYEQIHYNFSRRRAINCSGSP